MGNVPCPSLSPELKKETRVALGLLDGAPKNFFRYIDITFLLFLYKEEPDCTSKPPVDGPCNAAFTRFYFDKYDNKCKKFIWGGCWVNNNNYKTKEECYYTCAWRGKLWLNRF